MIPNYQFFKYNPIYQGSTNAEEMQVAQMGAQVYDRNLENYTKLSILKSKLRGVSAEDQKYLNDKLDEADQGIRELAVGVQGKKRWDLGTSAVQQMAMTVQADSKINAIDESYKMMMAGEEQKMQHRGKGEVSIEFNDPSKHKTVNEDGTINIFRPHIEAQGNYNGEIQGILANIKPDQSIVGLTPSELEGVWRGGTVRGINAAKIKSVSDNIYKAYIGSSAGGQEVRVMQKDGMDDASIEKNLRAKLLSRAMLGTYTEQQAQYMKDDIGFLDAKNAQEISKIQAKGGKVSKQLGEDAYRVMYKAEGEYVPNKAGKAYRSTYYHISNEDVANGLVQETMHLGKDKYKVLAGNELTDEEFGKIGNIHVKGINTDATHGAEFIGGFWADVEVGLGPNKRIVPMIIAGNNTGRRNTMSVVSKAREANKEGYKWPSDNEFVIPDTGGILRNSANAEMVAPTGFSAVKSPDGSVLYYAGKMKPDGSWVRFKRQELLDTGLDESYTLEELDNMTMNKVAAGIIPNAISKKKFTESPQDPYN